MRCLMLTLVLAASTSAQFMPNTEAQREAMKKLSFLVGTWNGPATAHLPAGPLQVTQTEEVQYKLGGLVLLVEGTGRLPDGTIRFNALATISYDENSKQYRVRAHNDGRFVDAELKLTAKGFQWGYQAGPAKVNFTMTLTDKGQWQEIGEYVVGNQPPQKSIELLVSKQ
jgi:hypothetical protein